MRFAVFIAAAAAVVAAPLGHRVGLLPLGPAFVLLLAGVALALGALVFWAVALARGSVALLGDPRVTVAGVVAAVAAVVPLAAILSAAGAPAIHDVTTDTGDPPRFEAVVPLRADAPNSLEYGGPELAAAQRAAYPELAPLTVDLSVEAAVETAQAVAEALGWRIVSADPARGLLEATDTTFWFGFEDDVAVRVRPAGDSRSRVDVRSVSRVGVGDLGANAARIEAFLERMRAAAER